MKNFGSFVTIFSGVVTMKKAVQGMRVMAGEEIAQLADLYRKAGRAREAVALCRDGLARYPHYTTAQLILAKALAADGQLAAARKEGIETVPAPGDP